MPPSSPYVLRLMVVDEGGGLCHATLEMSLGSAAQRRAALLAARHCIDEGFAEMDEQVASATAARKHRGS